MHHCWSAHAQVVAVPHLIFLWLAISAGSFAQQVEVFIVISPRQADRSRELYSSFARFFPFS